MPGNLAATIDWKRGPTRFEFLIHRDRLEIKQEGRLLDSAHLRSKDGSRYKNLKVNWGTGVFGRLNGKLKKHLFEPHQ